MEERIGHYRIVSELGRGGMGVVYKAHEESLNRFVALKVLGDHLAEDADYVERFQREARSAASLNHPNIVQVYRVDEDEGQHYFAMEYVSGTSIQKMIKTQGPLDPIAATRLILQATSGLGAAHERGVIHRDIKPANLLVDDRGLVKIADFGLALLAGGATRLTATGMFMGTPGYLSPEQCLDEDPDHRTDIYSLGVTYYEMLTGLIPFTADSPLALLRQIIEVEPKDVRELNPDVPGEIRAILKKMMAKDRNHRYANCGDLITDLQAFLETAGRESTDVSSVVAAAAAATASGDEKTVVEAALDEPTVRTEVPGGDFNTSPTVAVDSTEIAGAAPVTPPPPPPQPGAPTEPVAAGEPQLVPEKEAEATGGRKTAVIVLAIAAAAVVILISGGLLAAWKFGLFGGAGSRIADGGAGEDAESVLQLTGERTENVGEASVAEIQPGAESAGGEVGFSGPAGSTAAEGSGSQATASAAPAVESASGADRTAEAGGSADLAARAEGTPSKSSSSGVPPPSGDATQTAEAGATDHPAAQPEVGTGVALVFVGEPLLANAAADYVRENLGRRGLEVFDASGIPGVMDTIESGPEAGGRTLAELIRSHARWAVVVRADFMGERQLRYQGRYDTEFQARLHVVAHDLKTLSPLGRGIHQPIGYTHLTVERKVEEALRRKLGPMGSTMASAD